MRQIQVNIYPRPGTTDIEFYFSSNDQYDAVTQAQGYQFVSAALNYSIQTSSATSTLVLCLNKPPAKNLVFRSGQPVEIFDNGKRVFQGVLLTIEYDLFVPARDDAGGWYMTATLAPSLFQLTVSPMIFDSTQANQIASLLNVDIKSIVLGGVSQEVATKTLLDYIISNTDYSHIFNRTISTKDLSDKLYLMASTGQTRDSVLRSSIDFYNCVLFQQEDGQIVIRQIDAKLASPFTIDITNEIPKNNTKSARPVLPILQGTYNDNAALTPAAVSNYNILDPQLSIGAEVSNNCLTYKPSPKFYPRVEQLQNSGWFTGILEYTPINDNIINNPSTVAALNGFLVNQDQYMISSKPSTAKTDVFGAYQQLLTAKQMAQSLESYSSLTATVSLDDPNVPADFQNIVGTILPIQNCDMESGVIATCTRNYSLSGSYLSVGVAPMGSITGFWKNS